MNRSLFAHGRSPRRAGLCSQYIWNINSSKRTFIKAQNRDLLKVGYHLGDTRNPFRPVVALESTIYTHGWSYPENIELAFHLQDLVRHEGATPATVGIMDGVATVGLSDREIVTLCRAAGKPETMKVSRRDLPFILGMGIAGRPIHGGTTVSGTMVLARRAGINVLGTGGIGGVHTGGQDNMDIYADLTELGRTPIAVISSGCKSFLDIPRTLEFLETHGTTVATFADGRSGNINFPEFYTRDSGVKSPLVFQNAKEAAAIVYSLNKLGSRRDLSPRPGVLLANPIPEEFSIPKSEIIESINQAVQEASNKGISGHENTPFILARIKDLTKGCSVTANHALIESNVKLAAKIAVELALLWEKELSIFKIRKTTDIHLPDLSSKPLEETCPPKIINKYQFSDQHEFSADRTLNKKPLHTKNFDVDSRDFPDDSNTSTSRVQDIQEHGTPTKDSPDIVVLGAVAIDLTCNFVLNPHSAFKQNLQPNMRTSNNSRFEHSLGGVGHNVALAAHLVSGNQRVRLCSLVAEDLPGTMAIKYLKFETLDTSGIKVLPNMIERSGVLVPNQTAQYVAVNDGKKDLVLGMADMQIFRQNSYEFPKSTMENLKWVVIDANWNQKVVREFMNFLRVEYSKVKIAYEPVSEKKGADIFRLPTKLDERAEETSYPVAAFPNHKIDLITPNLGELREIFRAATLYGYLSRKDYLKVFDTLKISEPQIIQRYEEIAGEQLTKQDVPSHAIQLLPFIPTILTTVGFDGVLLSEIMKIDDPRLDDPRHQEWIVSRPSKADMHIGGIYMRLYSIPAKVGPAEIVSSNGAGDTFLGVLIAGLSRGLLLDEELIEIAQKGAAMTLKCKQSVSPSLGELQTCLDRLARNSVNTVPPNIFNQRPTCKTT